jgi:hypothetical protein
VANKAKQQRGIRAILPAFILRSVPTSVAFEPRSNNKKKGDKRGVFRGDLRGKENYPPRAFDCKIGVSGVN